MTAAAHQIEVQINGRPTVTGAATLRDLLDELGFADQKIATALNGSFVARPARDATPLSPGDRIEIVSARQGG
jgi:sulfur carrier protein